MLASAPTREDPPLQPIYSTHAQDPDIADLIAGFVAGLPARAESLCADQPLEDLRLKVHRLSGAAGGYGFPEITAAAFQLEQALDEHDPRVPRLVAELVALCLRARAIAPEGGAR